MIYTTGTIAVSGNTVTGKGTEFNAALSLIRVGCTLIAISDPVQIFSITEVKSATSLSVTPAASPSIPAGTKFSILLSDSISVDGLAQDVAETLRYYQGKESEIADAVEFFSDNKDVISASKLASESATTATNAATTATTAANSAKTYRDEAHEYANQTAQPYAYVLQPLPDVWIPFNDSLDMLTGYGPGTKKVTIDGEEKTISSDKVVSFSRASTATYINKSGVLTTADIDEPRFEREGLLIEGTRTNYLRNSNNPASWPIHSQLTKETGADENGFNYATVTVSDDLVGTTGGYTVHGVVTADRFALAAGESLTLSALCRGTNARCRARISIIVDGTDTFSADSYLNLNTGEALVSGDTTLITTKSEQRGDWYYFETTYTAKVDIDAVNCSFYISNLVNDSFYSDSSMALATPQIELGSCASSFIVSGDTPTTRASDMVSIPTKNNLFKPPFSFLLELHKEWTTAPNAAPRVFDIANANTGQSVIAAINRGSSKFYVSLSNSSGTYINSAADSVLPSKAIVGAVVKGDDTFHAIMDGVAVADTTCSYGGVTQDKNIRFGGQVADGARHLFGHIRNFRIWHKALTDSQLSEIV
ncbi:TPA: LamG-like jellyroll fold domain-containing protein [Escherichia coli]